MGVESFDEIVDSVNIPRDNNREQKNKLAEKGNDIDRSLEVAALVLDSDYSDCIDLQSEAYKYPDLSEDPDVDLKLKDEYESLRKEFLSFANRMKNRVGYLAGKVNYLKELGAKEITINSQYRKDYDSFKLDYSNYKSGVQANDIVVKNDFGLLLDKKADIELIFSERLGLEFDGVSVKNIDQKFKFSDRVYNQLRRMYEGNAWEQVRYYQPGGGTFRDFLASQSLDFPEEYRRIIPGKNYNADGGTDVDSKLLLDAFNLKSFNYVLPKNLVLVLRVASDGKIDVRYSRLESGKVVPLDKRDVSRIFKRIKSESNTVVVRKSVDKPKPKSGFKFNERGVLINGKLNTDGFDFIPDKADLKV